MKTGKNPRKYTGKFWIIFWLTAALALFGWYVFLQVKNRNIENLKPLTNILPVNSERKNELQVLADIYDKMGGFQQEQTFLVLFQNDMELRPGGGFIGSFGIVKTKNGKIADLEVHDTGNFDQSIPNTENPPAPIAEAFPFKGWKMRDSNWSPDFRVNAEKAEYFYKLGGGSAFAEASADDKSLADKSADKKNFDGVIAVNTDILNSILDITGPVKINGYPGQYNDQTAVLQLEYQVEKGFIQQGITKGERKNILGELAAVLIGKSRNFSISEQLELAQKIEEHLKRKDIQFFFKDEALQKEIDALNWGGRVKDSEGDYLMIVDANLNSLKSDICIRRKLDYAVDLRGENPQAVLNITYEHTCRAKDWMTADYHDWLRVYVPEDSFLLESSGQEGSVTLSNELDKKVFGMKVFVPIGEKKTITLKYSLPKEITGENYHLLLQKQSGSGDLPVKIDVRKKDGSEVSAQETLTGDREFSL
ncbi:MAG: DUF4012 domain-containing protein [Candidatus Moranbacteria bacterium]|nr:DUF4012 domain-containing protein [Candidatus Moranbacteria bacterium]